MIEHDEVFRIKTERIPGTLARVLTMIGEHGATIGDIETVSVQHDHNVRDVTVIAPGAEAVAAISQAISTTAGAELVDHVDKVFAKHEGGKLAVVPTVDIETLQDVREIYTPGVARVSSAIADDPALADRYTWRGRTVAIVTNGTRVLGLGNIGPKASLPVMEGKAMFYSMLVGLNAVPIVLDTEDPDEIIETVVRIAPGFGAIHLEDIANPGVYRIEDELDRLLPTPVMHDDQHGTATVVLGAVIAAARRLGRPLDDMVFGQVGLGAAGSAIAALASRFPFKRVIAFNRSEGGRTRLKDQIEPHRHDNVDAEAAMEDVIAESDVLVLAVAQPDFLKPEQVTKGSVVFAISNPVPEITMADAIAGGAAISADGTIVNNVLAYPGLFKGALDAGATAITPGMRTAAALALADMAPAGGLLPHPLDRDVHAAVAAAVASASDG